MPTATSTDGLDPCPCGRGSTYAGCCGRLLRGEATAATAEQLMRSRFSAFAVRDERYLLATWDAATRPVAVRFDDDLTWTGLAVLDTTGGALFDSAGTVEFEARYVSGGHPGVLHEHSTFARVDGSWVYVGAIAEAGHPERDLHNR